MNAVDYRDVVGRATQESKPEAASQDLPARSAPTRSCFALALDLLLIFTPFCVAEHRRDLGVERQGCRESLAGPWMAHQGGPLNPEKRRAPAGGRPRTRLAFFLVPSFFGFGILRRPTDYIPIVVAKQKR